MEVESKRFQLVRTKHLCLFVEARLTDSQTAQLIASCSLSANQFSIVGSADLDRTRAHFTALPHFLQISSALSGPSETDPSVIDFPKVGCKRARIVGDPVSYRTNSERAVGKSAVGDPAVDEPAILSVASPYCRHASDREIERANDGVLDFSPFCCGSRSR